MFQEVPRPTNFVVKKYVFFEIIVFPLTCIPITFPFRSSTWRRCNSGWRSSTAWTWHRRTRRSPTTIPSSPNDFWPNPNRWTRWRIPTRSCRGKTCTRTLTATTQRLEKKKKASIVWKQKLQFIPTVSQPPYTGVLSAERVLNQTDNRIRGRKINTDRYRAETRSIPMF